MDLCRQGSSFPVQTACPDGYILFRVTSLKTATMIEITCNDRLGKKVRVKCNPEDTIGDLKKLIAAQTGTRFDKIVLKKWYTIFKDNITLADYEIHDGQNLELYYQ